MTRAAAKPSRAGGEGLRAKIRALKSEVARLVEVVVERLPPAPAPVDDDPPVGLMSAAALAGKSPKVLRKLIKRGAGFGNYDGATDRYVCRLRALRDYMAAHGETIPEGLKGV
jgi:hypothetical protein